MKGKRIEWSDGGGWREKRKEKNRENLSNIYQYREEEIGKERRRETDRMGRGN